MRYPKQFRVFIYTSPAEGEQEGERLDFLVRKVRSKEGATKQALEFLEKQRPEQFKRVLPEHNYAFELRFSPVGKVIML